MTHFKLIQENCPGGCPCDAYECEDITPTVTTTSVATTTVEPTSKDAVLLLSTFFQSNVPMVIGYNGKLHLNMNLSLLFIANDNNNILGQVDDDINFAYEDNTVYYSCAASLNDEMWVLGGGNQKRQVNFK